LDCAKIWIVLDLDRARFGLCKIWIVQDLDRARFGSCKIWVVQIWIFQTTSQMFWIVQIRDGNSSEIFTPQGIEEWQFTIPRGSRKNESIPWGPRGISRNGMLFYSAHFSGFTGIFGIIIWHYNQKY
jgi:hypothetical protein